MMTRLQCTWSALQAEPYEELEICRAFATGENEGRASKAPLVPGVSTR